MLASVSGGGDRLPGPPFAGTVGPVLPPPGSGRWLAGRAPASASDVAAGVGVHPNTARAHLAALDEAGIAERLARSDGRRGRPVVRYRIDPGWMPAGDELLALSELPAAALAAAEPD